METLIHAGLMNALFAALLAVNVAGLAILCRRRPAVVHALWLLVLVKFLVPSVFPVEIPWWRPSPSQPDGPEPVAVQENSAPARILVDQTPNPAEDFSPEPMISEPPPAEILQPADENLPSATTDPSISPDASAVPAQLSWEMFVAMVWLTGSLAWMAVAGFRIIRFHRILRLAKPAHSEVQIRVRKLAERLGLSVCPAIAFVSAPIAPSLWALTRSPRLSIPAQLWERLNEEQRDTLLVHELAHLRRGDHWVRRLEMVVLALYWWHPVVWWAQRQLREAEEQCCDAWVLWVLPNAAQDYAVALVETLAFLCRGRPALPLGASGIEPMRLLKRRLSMIVQGHTPRGMSRLAFWAVVGLGLLLLPLLPIPAQQPGNPTNDDEEQVQDPAPPRNPPAPTDTPALQPPPAVGLPIRADRAEQTEAARDEVELMRAKLMIRRAELDEIKTRIRLVQRNLIRVEEGFKKGAVPESMLESARTEAELLPSQLNTKQAQIQEAEILLKQAQRRLRRLEAGQKTEEAPLLPPTMQPKGAPMKGPSGLLPANSGAARKPAAGRPIEKAPPGSRPPGLPAGPGAGKAPPASPALPQGPGPGTAMVPPSDDAEGVVLEADAKTGLVTVSIGTDSGLKPGSKLEVYRLKPNPKYLGKMEILEAQQNRAVGRLADARWGAVEKGDLVAGKLIGDLPGFKPTSSWARFDATNVHLGTRQRGERVGHMFRVTNTLKEPIHLASMRVSAAFVTAKALVNFDDLQGELMVRSEAWIAPHQSIYIYVELDTGRFAGDKTSSVYVQFDQPSAATVQLQVRVNSQDSPAGADSQPEPSRDPKTRIMELEHQMHQLMMEIDDLRDQLKQQPAKPRSGTSRSEPEEAKPAKP